MSSHRGTDRVYFSNANTSGHVTTSKVSRKTIHRTSSAHHIHTSTIQKSGKITRQEVVTQFGAVHAAFQKARSDPKAFAREFQKTVEVLQKLAKQLGGYKITNKAKEEQYLLKLNVKGQGSVELKIHSKSGTIDVASDSYSSSGLSDLKGALMKLVGYESWFF